MIVESPDGNEIEFPDNMSVDQINNVMRQKFSPLQSKNLSLNSNTQNNINPETMSQYNYDTGSNRTPLDTIRDIAYGALVGAGKGGQFIGNQMMKIPGMKNLAKDIQSYTGLSVPDVDIGKVFKPVASPNESIGGNIVKGISSYLPYSAIGGSNLIGQLAAGGLYGAANTPENESNLFGLLPSGSTGGAIENALLNALTHGVFHGADALRPSKLLRGNLSPDELKANLAVSEGTPTGLGDIIGSPFIKRTHENILTKIPFSGANNKFQQAANIVDWHGKNILNNLLGENIHENVDDTLNSALLDAFRNHKSIKNHLYDNVNDIADKSNLKLELPEFSEQAKKYMDAINSTNILKYEPDMASIFNKMKNYRNPVSETKNTGMIVDKSGNPLINETESVYPTLKEANILKGKLNDYAKSASHSPDASQRNLSGIFKNLSGKIKNDINSSIENSGNNELKNAYEIAEKNYSKNFSPFLDNEIYKFISSKDVDPDTLVSSFLKVSKGADRKTKLNKLTSLLPPDQQKLIGYAYFSRALDKEGNLNHQRFNTLYNNLGKNQLKVLVPDQIIRNQLKNYKRLYNMNTKSVNIMNNPMTGQQNLDVLPMMLAHAGTALAGGAIGNIPGAIIGLMAPGVISNALTRYFTNPSIRKSLVNAMIENKSWNPNALSALQAIARGNNSGTT